MTGTSQRSWVVSHLRYSRKYTLRTESLGLMVVTITNTRWSMLKPRVTNCKESLKLTTLNIIYKNCLKSMSCQRETEILLTRRLLHPERGGWKTCVNVTPTNHSNKYQFSRAAVSRCIMPGTVFLSFITYNPVWNLTHVGYPLWKPSTFHVPLNSGGIKWRPFSRNGKRNSNWTMRPYVN